MATATSREKRTAVRGLDEIALRAGDLEAMHRFYEISTTSQCAPSHRGRR